MKFTVMIMEMMFPLSHCVNKTYMLWFWQQQESPNPVSRSVGTKHRLKVIVLPIEKVSLTFIKANLRPKNFCLPAYLRPKLSFSNV